MYVCVYIYIYIYIHMYIYVYVAPDRQPCRSAGPLRRLALRVAEPGVTQLTLLN